MTDSESRQQLSPPRAYSYYYLDGVTVLGLLSQLIRLPPKELVEAILVKETHSTKSNEERTTNLSLGLKDSTLKHDLGRKEETGASEDSGLSVTSTYDQTETPFSLASLLELQLEEKFLVEDFNRRITEVISNWQEHAKSFSRSATERYKFDGTDLLRSAEAHTQRLIELHLDNLREKRLPESSSKLVTVRIRQFKWCSRQAGDGHFRFEGTVNVDVKFGSNERRMDVCSITGVGRLDYLSDGARELVKEETVIESAAVLGKFQSWSRQGNQIIVEPILIR